MDPRSESRMTMSGWQNQNGKQFEAFLVAFKRRYLKSYKYLRKRKIMKILALDLGDRWVGSAIADPLGITCKPYQTIDLDKLESVLGGILAKENISTVVIGYPKTMSGGESAQTIKIVKMKECLACKFPTANDQQITWILWDERLSSKRASALRTYKPNDAEAKKKSHSLAAAFILQSYLDYLAFNRV